MGAQYVAVIGESELSSGSVNLKKMSDGSTNCVQLDDLGKYITENQGGTNG